MLNISIEKISCSWSYSSSNLKVSIIELEDEGYNFESPSKNGTMPKGKTWFFLEKPESPKTEANWDTRADDSRNAIDALLFQLVRAEADYPSFSRLRDVTPDMWSHTFAVICNARSRLDWSDRKKCFIKHRSLYVLIPNVDIRLEKWIKITFRMSLMSSSAFLWCFEYLETNTPNLKL